MSIYATLWNIKLPVEVNGEDVWHEVYAQGVPSHIDDEVDWLPAPIKDSDRLRCVVFVEAGEPKGGAGYHGQQYHNPLLILTGFQYTHISHSDLFEKLTEGLEQKHWQYVP